MAVGYRKAEAAAQAQADAVTASNAALDNASTTMQDAAVGALANFAGGLWATADAAIQAGEGMGMAVAQTVKATLLGLAQQATVYALMELAHAVAALAGVVTAPLAAGHFKAAAAYGAVAAGTGAVGLGMSAGGVGTGASQSAASGAGIATPSSKVFGKEVVDKRPQFINVYLGDPNSRSSALLMKKELTTVLST